MRVTLGDTILPTSTVIWLWIGNRPLLDATPTSNVTQAELDASGINGYTAFGPTQIAAVSVTGDTTANGANEAFTAPFNQLNGFVSQFSFDSPTTPGVVTGQTIVATFRADVTISLPNNIDVNQVATIVQMANGNIFLRPNAQFVSQWDGIDALRSITINQTTPFVQNTVLNSTISFSPDIFDIEAPCFTAGNLILTPTGDRRAETLQVGDMVMTMDHGPQAIRWIAKRRVSGEVLAQRPDLRPVRISAGALGQGCPETDLFVSRQHRVLVRSRISQRMLEADEVLIAAVHLVGLPGIDPDQGNVDVTYVHFLCDQHEVVFANGAPTETLYPGPMALFALGEAATQEIIELFPAYCELGGFGLTPAPPLVKGRQGRSLAERHQKNAVKLVAA
jgi:hypothetical protein